MGLFDWLRRRPPARSGIVVARELAQAVFALHPSAKDSVVVHLGPGCVVAGMDVPATAPARNSPAVPDRALHYARVSQLVAELAHSVPRATKEVTVMRDRVIWMPAVIPINPPLL